jgi:hypothetical protein
MRSEGGKAPRPTCPRRILQTGEAVRKITAPPEANRLAMAVQLGRYPEMGWIVGSGRT